MAIFSNLNRDQREAVGLLQAGTFLEYFDLMLYIHMAVLLNELFFPKTDPYTASLLSAFAFCSTYILRPFGALLFGYIGDNLGRKTTVILTTMMMAFSCMIMASLPTYAQIGIAASWIMLLCRILQGLASMGEIIGAEIYLTEITKPPASYPTVGLIGLSSAIGSMAALGIASLVTVTGLNWRIAFMVGTVIALVGSMARTRLRETSEFVDVQKRIQSAVEEAGKEGLGKAAQLLQSTNSTWKEKTSWKTGLAYFLIQCGWPVCFYFSYIYCGDILKNTFGYTAEQVIRQNMAVSVIQTLSFLLFILLSTRIYPLKLLKFKLAVFIPFLLTVPFVLSYTHHAGAIFTLQAFSIFFALVGGPAMAIVISHLPVLKRFTYSSILYALSRALIYIITSFGLVYFTRDFGNWGILFVFLPMTAGFFWAVKYFEKLEVNMQGLTVKILK